MPGVHVKHQSELKGTKTLKRNDSRAGQYKEMLKDIREHVEEAPTDQTDLNIRINNHSIAL